MEQEHNGLPLDLKVRTKTYALRLIALYKSLPQSFEAQTLGKQVFRSGTSIGAHYREASRWKSDNDFISKMETALQELEETGYWLDLLIDAGIVPADRLSALQQETSKLTAIFITLVKKRKEKVKAESWKNKRQSSSVKKDRADLDDDDEA